MGSHDAISMFGADSAMSRRVIAAPAELASLLERFRYRFITEKDLQDGIEAVLKVSGIAYERERSLSAPDRPDFLVQGGIAIEVKIKGSLAELLRQVSRYAAHDEVSGILVCGTPYWLPTVPKQIGGKTLYSLRLVGSLL
ncbi:MAG TPA: hypothetical protein VF450_24755 [Noviherbaspirillum sp.]